MYSAVKGIYENGTLRLLEPAPDVNKSEVLVMFLTETKTALRSVRQPGGLLRLNKLKGKTLDIPDDFNDPIDDLKDYM
ncbi:hypothetical protein LPB86_02895 [Pedobacter sp. MC2016-14]|uniref:hypothetical protein n=1 Tax=Pedobacter sp. MC2016-14 TaxID=2897327 RepID=UPI001E4E8A67|nr:hypothetical protein [Pedobacter sp. MC2016-14]MCD0487158.1 hypothetical protein [Pedobacter sp. MC2016-14]